MNGERLGSRIRIVSQEELTRVVEEVLAAIDKIHAVSRLPEVPMYFTDEARFGAYVPETEIEARHFQLSRNGPHPALTMAHEIGHFLDDALGNFDGYSTQVRRSPLRLVLRATERSAALRALRDTLQSPDLPLVDRWQIEYWLHPAEVWARAYAQYIAVRSSSPRLLADLQVAVRLEGGKQGRPVQWVDSDFASIAAEIDSAFQKMRWLL